MLVTDTKHRLHYGLKLFPWEMVYSSASEAKDLLFFHGSPMMYDGKSFRTGISIKSTTNLAPVARTKILHSKWCSFKTSRSMKFHLPFYTTTRSNGGGGRATLHCLEKTQ